MLTVLTAGLACAFFMASLYNGFVLRPLPFPDPDALSQIGISDEIYPDYIGPLSATEFLDLQRHVAGIGAAGSFSRAAVQVTGERLPAQLDGALVSSNLFTVLGTAPLLGRPFNSADEQAGGFRVALISHELPCGSSRLSSCAENARPRQWVLNA